MIAIVISIQITQGLCFIILHILQALLKKMEKDKVSPSIELFNLVVRGVLVIAIGCLGIIFNIMIFIVLRRPAFKKSSINLLMLCKFMFPDMIDQKLLVI